MSAEAQSIMKGEFTMAAFKMSLVNSREFDRACTACQMAFGCIISIQGDTLYIAAFSDDEAPVIIDTLEDVGSNYEGVWAL